MFVPPPKESINWDDQGSSHRFRSILDFFETYAKDMSSNNFGKYELLRKELGELEEEWEIIQKEYGPYDEDDLEPDQRDYIEEFEREISYLHKGISLYYYYYPQILYQSLFVSIYALFERYLFDICHHLHKVHHLRFKEDEFHGKGITRAAQYIKKAAGIANFPDDRPEWSDIKLLADMRNSIIHIGAANTVNEFDRNYVQHHKKKVRLLNYFWLYDNKNDDEDEEEYFLERIGIYRKNIMFSIGSISRVIRTFKRFTILFDEVFEKHQEKPHVVP